MSFKDELIQIAKESDTRELNKEEMKVVEEMKKAMKRYVSTKGELTNQPVEFVIDVKDVSSSQINSKVIVKHFEDEGLHIQNLSVVPRNYEIFCIANVRVLVTVIL